MKILNAILDAIRLYETDTSLRPGRIFIGPQLHYDLFRELSQDEAEFTGVENIHGISVEENPFVSFLALAGPDHLFPTPVMHFG